mgnify:CR=1 FL=1
MNLRKYILAGLLVWLPLAITLWVLDAVLSTMDKALQLVPPNLQPDKLLGFHIPYLGALLVVIIVLGGIYGGVFTPTEAAVVAVFYALMAGLTQGGAALPLADLFPILECLGRHAMPLPVGQSIVARALAMGDECHNRNAAASSLLFRQIVPLIVASGAPKGGEVIDFINQNDHFFLNLSMAACKAALDGAANVVGSSFVTVMARNGVDFGLKLSGTGKVVISLVNKNDRPTSADQSGSVNENAGGSQVATVTASDQDASSASQTVSYALTRTDHVCWSFTSTGNVNRVQPVPVSLPTVSNTSGVQTAYMRVQGLSGSGIACASFSRSPAAPLRDTRSDPARSTRCSLPRDTARVARDVAVMCTDTTQCERDECSFMLVAKVARVR